MSHAHRHAARHGTTRLVLDVLPARTVVISFYRRLGYTETEPYATESPIPMIYMERPITSDDIHSIHGSWRRHAPDQDLRSGQCAVRGGS